MGSGPRPWQTVYNAVAVTSWASSPVFALNLHAGRVVDGGVDPVRAEHASAPGFLDAIGLREVA